MPTSAPEHSEGRLPMPTSASYTALQANLRESWPKFTLRSVGDVERTFVVLHSMSLDLPRHLFPVFPAYEERFLCLVLSLLRAPRSRVVYVTSQPILPRVVDYFFGLVPGLDTPESRARFHVVSLVDSANRPLTEKLLERPGAIERIRRLILDPDVALLLPFTTTAREVGLAVRLGLPVFGADPALAWLGTKQGSRRLFADAGVPHPPGREVRDRSDVVAAIGELRAEHPGLNDVVVKLNGSAGGLGNALVHVGGTDRTGLEQAVAALELVDERQDAEEYWGALERDTAIVEERIEGERFRSPSAQLQISPAGQVEILSTHDQVLGGRHAQKYFGCHFPADPDYAAQLAVEALKVGRQLAREGVLGRCAVDFAATCRHGQWELYALEINLRCGGTTHPFFALQALTDGRYDPLAGEYRTGNGELKRYLATDHLAGEGYATLTPDDLLDVVERRSLGWDGDTQTGIALHMVSALAAAGWIGLTAIGDTLDQARALYADVNAALDEAVQAPSEVGASRRRGDVDELRSG
jgi:PGM1 C-terminal domain